MTDSKRPAKVVAYVRVSTEKQADHGVSLEAQQAKIAAYCALYDLEVVEVIIDAGVSAKTLDRPGLTRALGMLRSKQADALLVVKLDRLTRSVRDLGDLVERYFRDGRAALLSVSEHLDTSSAAGRMVMNLLAVVSQWERETAAERTAAAMQHKVSVGEFTGGAVRYGYRLAEDGTHLETVEAEQEVLAAARMLRAAGLSLREVAEELDKRGFRSRVGKRFLAEQIRSMTAA